MTIHELLQAAGLTANDEIPIWDADGTGEPTKKITAQQLAAAVVALANLVTSVNNQTGAVSITPANIGAVAKTGDTMTGSLTLNNADRDSRAIHFSANGTETGWISTDDQTNVMQFLQHNPNVAGAFALYQFPAANENPYGLYEILTTKSPVTISQGGTGMTDAETFTQYTSNLGTDVNGRIRISRWGKMFIAHIAGSCGVAITANVTPMLSLTDSNYAPNSEVWAVFATLGNEPFRMYINSSGNLYSYKNLEQGTWIYGEIMWFAGK